MRVKPIFLLVAFIIAVLTISSFTLYFYFENKSYEAVELRLMSWADDLVLDIAKDKSLFQKDPAQFIYSHRTNEFIASSMLVEFVAPSGKILAKSPGLKQSDLPFEVGEDDVLKDIRFDDGTELKVYQREIDIEEENLGYVVVGLATQQITHNVERLRTILFIVMICTIIILLFGVSALHSLDRVQNQKKFLSFASHELRTPLSVISGHAEVALRSQQTADQYKETLLLIKEESDWMKDMVSNLLMVFRTGSGAEKIIKQELNFGELIADEASALKKRFPGKIVTLKLCEDSILKGDQLQLRKLVVNILENAARYSGANGKIDIDLSCEQNKLKFRVEDNGIGIDKELRKKVFDPFFRIESVKGEGMGLGLAISKWVVESHRGHIELQSEKGKGTIFTVTLPRE